MELPLKREITELNQLAEVCAELSNIFEPGDTLALSGNLGSGKTTFVIYLCGNWGIENVDSPSFALVNEYDGLRKVYHFDFYRIEKETELYDMGFHEYMNDPEAIKIIEWAEMYPKMLPRSRYELKFSYNVDDKRYLEITKYE